MDKEELNFETERARCRVAAIQLAAQMLGGAYRDTGRLAQCLGAREFGLSWLDGHFDPHDSVFEEAVLNMFLKTLEGAVWLPQ